MLTTDYDHGISQLKVVPTDRLTRDEAILDEAALNLAEQIRQWPQRPGNKTAAPQGPASQNPPPGAAGQNASAPQGFADQNAQAPEGPIDLTPPPDAASTDLPSGLNDTVTSNEAAMAQAQKALSDSDALLEGDTQ